MDDSLSDAHLTDITDLNSLCIKNPASTFLLRIAGNSMVELGIFDRDIAVCDKSLEAKDGSIIIAYYLGGFTIKEFKENPPRLVAYDGKSTTYPIDEASDFEYFGTVTNVIRSLRPKRSN